MKHIAEILRTIDKLQPASRVMNRIMEFSGDPEGEVSDLVDIVRYDQVLTANLLKMCNSAYYGFPVHVDSVDQAVKLLGTNNTVKLALLGSFGENLSKARKGYGLERGELWKASVASALLAESFSNKRYPGIDKFIVYTASLLRDIGKIIIDDYVGRSLKKIESLVNKRNCSFDEAETEVLGINHAEIGGLIAEKWNFNPNMVFIIRNHHLSDPNAREDLATAITHLVDTVARLCNVGIGADGLAYRVYEEIFGLLGVSETDMKDLLAGFKINIGIAEKLFNSL